MIQTDIQKPGRPRTSWLVNHSPVYYGWIIMLAGSLGLIMTSPGQTYVVSIFIESIIRDLGISRSLVSSLYMMGTLSGGFALPFIGRKIDRHGTRLMVIIVASLFGLACIYMGFVRNALMLGIGFTAIRLLGQGSLSLVSQNVINQWWVQRRGMIMGISGILVGLLGLGLFPRIVNGLIPVYGWQNTYIMLGLSLFMVMVPIGLLFFHNRPEEYGLQPDGGPVMPGQGDNPRTVIEENWSLQEANRTPVYWALALGMGSTSMLSTGLFFHMVSIFDDNGLSTTVAASAFLPIAVTSGLVNLSGGILIDRIPPRFLLACALFAQTGALILAQHLTDITSAFIYGIILGTSMGLIGTVNSVVWAKYFGRQHLGSITGMTTSILIIGAAVGPLPLGLARDVLGSYNLALTVGAILPLVLGLVNLFFDKPSKYSTI